MPYVSSILGVLKGGFFDRVLLYVDFLLPGNFFRRSGRSFPSRSQARPFRYELLGLGLRSLAIMDIPWNIMLPFLRHAVTTKVRGIYR